jgi:hypothetical protein
VHCDNRATDPAAVPLCFCASKSAPRKEQIEKNTMAENFLWNFKLWAEAGGWAPARM